jgi:hypothetical protein
VLEAASFCPSERILSAPEDAPLLSAAQLVFSPENDVARCVAHLKFVGGLNVEPDQPKAATIFRRFRPECASA